MLPAGDTTLANSRVSLLKTADISTSASPVFSPVIENQVPEKGETDFLKRYGWEPHTVSSSKATRKYVIRDCQPLCIPDKGSALCEIPTPYALLKQVHFMTFSATMHSG